MEPNWMVTFPEVSSTTIRSEASVSLPFEVIALSCRIGLLFCLLTLGLVSPAVAEFACSADDLSSFDERLLEGDCEEVHSVPINGPSGTSTLRVVRYANPSHGADAWIPMVDELAARVGAAMRAMGGVRLQGTVSVFLVPDFLIASIPGTSGVGPIHGNLNAFSGEECFLAFYKLPTAVSTEEFVFTLAHEIFHCVQYETWPDTANLPEADWWAEGSAEFFANLALPGSTSSNGWLTSYDNRSIAEPPTAMAYENLVLFSWLAQRGGPGAVPAFLSQMRAGDQLAVLREVLPLADWTGFVETWLDGGIALPGGVAIEPSPAFSAEGRFDSPIVLELNAQPYVIERWDMTFVEDKLFELEYGVTGGAMQAAMKETGSGDAWAAPPPKIDTCEAERRHILYHTSTDGPASATLKIDTDEDTSGGACCLVGTWMPTPETLAGLAAFGNDVGGPAVAAVGASMACDHVGGDWLLSFGRDRTGSIAFDGHSTRCTARAQGGAMSNTGTRTGHTDFAWLVRGEGNASVRYTGHEVGWTHVLKIGPVSQTVAGSDDGPSSMASGFAFTCDETSLTVKGIYGLSTYEAAHTRVPVAAP
jgi:hypothetical protein